MQPGQQVRSRLSRRKRKNRNPDSEHKEEALNPKTGLQCEAGKSLEILFEKSACGVGTFQGASAEEERPELKIRRGAAAGFP